MNAAPFFLGYAAAVGVLAPRALLRSSWPQRSPLLAVAVWFALAASFSVCVALAALHLTTPGAHLHGILYSCRSALGLGPSGGGLLPGLGIAAVAVLAAAHLTGFAEHTGRAYVARARHREILDKVGRRSACSRATVVEHTEPAAYCLPGRHPRIVLSSGAVGLLSGGEVDAVVEHERAHIRGRHHLVLAAAHAFTRVFPGVPLARHLQQQVPLLLEMAADDHALRRCPRGALAAAMFTLAAGEAPNGALAAGGRTVLVRLRRVLAPAHRAHPALRCAVGTGALITPVLPVLLTCHAGLG
ncbi:M56 family metallopeptidase [Streptomyces sp. McG3]|uniref:M56 family metallopeptidase n=1 Tax=Streptomyces sp. McG3 TaxID=2725483 RepID=UPI001BE9C4E3|nr:M56 family metallopeptidase [Streptomyces sp. McG3]MBT2895716.1 M56 family metallopeptidase [Streptomyces sp. McG3]